MSDIRVIDVKQIVFASNDARAQLLRQELKQNKTFLLNLMPPPVPEGHDKPLKYPLIFTVCDALIINKIDVLPYFDFDIGKVVQYAHMRNPNLKIFPISAKTGEGVALWCSWLADAVKQWNGQ